MMQGVQRPPFEKCYLSYSEIKLDSDNPQSENCWGILRVSVVLPCVTELLHNVN